MLLAQLLYSQMQIRLCELWRCLRFGMSTFRKRDPDVSGQPFSSSTSSFIFYLSAWCQLFCLQRVGGRGVLKESGDVSLAKCRHTEPEASCICRFTYIFGILKDSNLSKLLSQTKSLRNLTVP